MLTNEQQDCQQSDRAVKFAKAVRGFVSNRLCARTKTASNVSDVGNTDVEGVADLAHGTQSC